MNQSKRYTERGLSTASNILTASFTFDAKTQKMSEGDFLNTLFISARGMRKTQ